MNRYLDILRDAFADSGYRLWALIILMPVVGVSDGIAMALLYPLIAMVGMGGPNQADLGTLGQSFRWLFEQMGVEPTLSGVSLVVIVAFSIQGILFTAQNWLLTDIQKKYIASWQQKMFSDFVGSEWSYFLSQKHGEMVNLILSECYRLGAAFISILQIIAAVIVTCVYFAISLVLSWKLTLYLFVAALVLFLLVWPIRVATRRNGEEFGQINSDFVSTLNEMLSGAKLIKASAAEGQAKAIISDHVDKIRNNLTWGAFLPTNIRVGFEFAAILMILGALVYGLSVDRAATPQILMLMALVARLIPRLMQLQQLQNTLNLSMPAYKILTEARTRFGEHREARRSGAMASLDSTGPFAIEGKGIAMRYGDQTVLKKVSFSIPAGHVVGFVGPSGAGKSTLIDVIMGLVLPSEGEINIGTVPLRDINLVAWRRKIGYVSQDTFLFHDTIANNIRWSVPDAPMTAVRAAAEAAGFNSFVEGLQSGYDTIVGDRGAKLSGGQRQRISVARALIRQPALLVLDEATSALDSLSEQEVMGAINKLRGRMTIVIVAHRLATVLGADLIYVLDDGKIVEQGSWDALSKRRALFHRLMQAQAITEGG